MDDPMDLDEFTGWRSVESTDESMDSMEYEDEEMDAEDFMVSGLTADQQKVLAVVKNNDTEEGADITSDFAHLGSKFLNWGA